jgi:pantothenate kinase
MVTEQTIDISSFSQKQKDYYLNLFWETIQVCSQAKKPRVIIGIAGPTGAGKSVVSVLLKELAKQASLPFAFETVTIDAYHFPNSYLLDHYSDGIPLKKVKGRFDTYDAAALIKGLKAFAAGQNIAFPAYSRKLHDPVPNSLSITRPATLLLVEGLWLLSDYGDWALVRTLLDFSYFIESDKERTRQAVIKRHMAGGRSLEDATRHYNEVDGCNSELTLQTRNRAGKIIPPYYLIT